MAEGWARHLKGDIIDPHSAGTDPKRVDRLAVNVMREVEVDISGQISKNLTDLDGNEFEFVITVCDNARKVCPIFPGDTRIFHKTFDDPPYLARSAKTEDEKRVHDRRVRDEIRTFVEKLPVLLLEKRDIDNAVL